MHPPLRVHASTHEGLVHDKNEDSFAVVETEEGGALLLVCDGMGGMGRGEQASAMAVEHITRLVRDGRGFAPERLRRAIREADVAVRTALCAEGRGMPGSTAVMIYVLDGMGHVAWVGDSRAYLVRGGRVVERTRDHKLVNDLVAAGQLTEEEARGSALAHVVTRALGGRPPSDRPVKASTLGHPWKLAHGDVMMLCSDGVCDLLADEEIASLLTGADPEQGARNLVKAALDRGGHDNITCIVSAWEGADYVEDDKLTPSFTTREHVPELDVRDAAALAEVSDDGRGVTEEIEPGWRPGDDEDTGDTYPPRYRASPTPDPDDGHTTDLQALRVAANPEEQALDAPTRRGPGPLIWAALVIGLLVLAGLGIGALTRWS